MGTVYFWAERVGFCLLGITNTKMGMGKLIHHCTSELKAWTAFCPIAGAMISYFHFFYL
jgi:hypothetical protein